MDLNFVQKLISQPQLLVANHKLSLPKKKKNHKLFGNSRSKLEQYKGIRTNSSVISGNTGYDKHEVECDYELNHKRLHVWSSRQCSWKVVLLPLEEQPKSSTCKCWSKDLSCYISRHLQVKNLTGKKGDQIRERNLIYIAITLILIKQQGSKLDQ